jgi:predicted MPP superfamily phosphohydrolase
MYLQNELLLSIPLVLYACLRIRSLIGSRLLKNLWAALFILIAAGYPLAETLSHRPGSRAVTALMFFGYSALPLVLYVVMTVFAVDAAVGLLRLTRVVSRETVRSPRFKTRRLVVSLAIPAIVVVLGAINHRVLRVHDDSVAIPRRSAAAGQMTVVFMADLHFRDLTSNKFLDELVDKVNAQKPDLILLGGDLLEGDRRDEDLTRYERAFRRMRSTYGLFGVPGNHEGHSRIGRGAFLERSGIRLLQDESVVVGGELVLVGRKDSRRNREPLAELLAGARHDLPVVLLVHRPLEFDEARAAGVDIQLSGHTHHGQLFPVNLITALQYDLSWGHLEKGGAHLFVTSGVQGWGPPVRTVGASEILVIRLTLR